MARATAAYNDKGFVGLAKFVVARSFFEAARACIGMSVVLSGRMAVLVCPNEDVLQEKLIRPP